MRIPLQYVRTTMVCSEHGMSRPHDCGGILYSQAKYKPSKPIRIEPEQEFIVEFDLYENGVCALTIVVEEE